MFVTVGGRGAGWVEGLGGGGSRCWKRKVDGVAEAVEA